MELKKTRSEAFDFATWLADDIIDYVACTETSIKVTPEMLQAYLKEKIGLLEGQKMTKKADDYRAAGLRELKKLRDTAMKFTAEDQHEEITAEYARIELLLTNADFEPFVNFLEDMTEHDIIDYEEQWAVYMNRRDTCRLQNSN